MTTPGRLYAITDPRIEESRHVRWMNVARKLAKTSLFPQERMGCVLVAPGGRPISRGTNQAKSGYLKNKNYTVNQAHHSELAAVLNANKDSVRGSTAYVAGYTPNKSEDVPCWSSRPCEGCQAMLREYGVKYAVFHDRVGNLYKYKVS